TYPVRVRGTEEFLDARESLLSAGYRRLLVRGEARDIDDVKPSEVLVDSSNAVVAARGRRRARASAEQSATVALGALEVIVDRVRVAGSQQRRIGAAIEEAWRRADGHAAIVVQNGAAPQRVEIARGLCCPKCATTFAPPRPGLFSYQSPVGACAACRGF